MTGPIENGNQASPPQKRGGRGAQQQSTAAPSSVASSSTSTSTSSPSTGAGDKPRGGRGTKRAVDGVAPAAGVDGGKEQRRGGEEHIRGGRNNRGRRDYKGGQDGSTTQQTETPAPEPTQQTEVAPATQQPAGQQHYPAHLEHQIAQMSRINAIVPPQRAKPNQEEAQLVVKVGEVVAHKYSPQEILNSLRENGNDVDATITALSTAGRSWNEVVKKKVVKEQPPPPQPQQPEQKQQRKEKKQQQQQQQQQQNSPAQQPQQPQQPQQNHTNNANNKPQRKIDAQHQAHQQQPAVQQQQPNNQLVPQDLMMGLSVNIETQLQQFMQQTKILLQLKNELLTINTEGAEQLKSLQSEKKELLASKEQLQDELLKVEKRLGDVEVSIQKAEREKVEKLNEVMKKSQSHGFLSL